MSIRFMLLADFLEFILEELHLLLELLQGALSAEQIQMHLTYFLVRFLEKLLVSEHFLPSNECALGIRD